ncbi:phosphatidylinositol-specific phospholipase C1-like protein [Rosistilla ulvae]|nr:phosphatidylinositol-specific phospholipase C1-like protein [Rosistilla ulvae]
MPIPCRLALFAICVLLAGFASGDELRLNHIQVIGTHNSYRQQPHRTVRTLIETTSKEVARTLEYDHRPLPEQFSDFGIRQIELDVFNDPQGGLFATPRGIAVAKMAGATDIAPYDPEGLMKKPGLKVLHVQDVDYVSTVPTFTLALQTIKAWSDANPRHIPIMILVELKQDRPAPLLTAPVPFDAAALDAVDEEICSVFSDQRIVTPDSVRGKHASLRAAISAEGWPTLSACRGKVIFAMDNPGRLPRDYMNGHDYLEGRAMFVDLGPNHPAGVFRKLNNPVAQYDAIQAAVKAGCLVRTRADADTQEARANDYSRAEKAFSSGAHFVSTDYPYPDETKSSYRVRLPDEAVFRPNPLLIPTADSTEE